MKFLWATDQHFKDTPPISRKDNWLETCLDKVRQVRDLAELHGVEAVLYGGDFFDVKVPSRTSHALVRSVIEAHSSFPCPVYSNVGNHDLKLGKLEFLSQGPLATLFACGTFKPCYDEHEFSTPLVRVVGIPFHGVNYDLTRFEKIRKKGSETIICMAHLLASPKGGTMFEGEDIIRYEDLMTLAPEVEVFCFGHWHKDQGIQTLPSGQIVVNVGSTSRGSLSQDNLDRIPSVALITVSEQGRCSAEQVFLKVKPAEEVFDLEKAKLEEERDQNLSLFVQRVKELSAGVSRTDLETELGAYGLPAKVYAKAVQYVEHARNRR